MQAVKTNFPLEEKVSIFGSKYLLCTRGPETESYINFYCTENFCHFLFFTILFIVPFCNHCLQCIVFINDLTVQDCKVIQILHSCLFGPIPFLKIFNELCHTTFLTSPFPPLHTVYIIAQMQLIECLLFQIVLLAEWISDVILHVFCFM